ncbi:hypothetical protein [Rodentibacter myodis]|uniref:Lipoprotein n=1 Tax=Rodentibacter myodis TaxID=1907939 RepID=A0A1V3JJI6_9PAST|nr:hypothetical protein [Rodentibacter myodis]OOF56940.1 hypothetical protein BKL49_10035 [Rodentibacter myodis]
MKNYFALFIAGSTLSGCVNIQADQAKPTPTSPQQNVNWTPEQYAKLTEAINKNKEKILEQLNNEAKKLEGKTFQIPINDEAQ